MLLEDDARLARMRFEKAQADLAHLGEVLCCVAIPNAAFIFTETNIQLPMQVVFDSPMAPQARAVVTSASLLGADEITRLRGRLAIHGALAVTHANGCQTRPQLQITNFFQVPDDVVAPYFVPPMAFVF